MISIALENGYHLFQSGVSTGKTRLFRSPWRSDKNPSLKINEQTHEWVDFGDNDPDHIKSRRDGSKREHAGGDTIDFVSIIKFGKVYPFLSSNEKKEVRQYLESRSPGLFRLTRGGVMDSYTDHSSASAGVYLWEQIGRRYGMHVNRYYYNEKDPSGNRPLTQEQYNECVYRVYEANKTLCRKPERLLPILSRYWMQVAHADAVFVVGRFTPGDSGIIEGGGAWAVQMAFDAGKPVYLYEETLKTWLKHEAGQDPSKEVKRGWVPFEGTPVLTRSFGGFGSKNITPSGEEAIRDCFRETLYLLGVEMKDEPVKSAAGLKTEAVGKDAVTISESENESLTVFSERPFSVGQNHFPTIEHFIEWSKAEFAGAETAMQRILAVEDPFAAREIGDSVKLKDHSAWEERLPSVIDYALVQSFFTNPDAAYRLLKTESAPLRVEDDRYPGYAESLAALRSVLYESCNGNINQYRSNRRWVVDMVRPGLDPTMPHRDGQGGAASTGVFRIVERLLNYMQNERCIPRPITDRYCYEVKAHIEYEEEGETRKEKPVYAVGFLNSVGGFELRKENFTDSEGNTKSGMKVCTNRGKAPSLVTSDGHKVIISDDPAPYEEISDIVVFPSFDAYLDQSAHTHCWVFEGFTDFLSCLAWTGQDCPPVDCIILNSTSGARAMLPVLARYDKVTCFLDNDCAGRQATKMIMDDLAKRRRECVVIDGMDGNEAFAEYNDINEAWQAHQRGASEDFDQGIDNS